MSSFNPEKLKVDFRFGVTPSDPIIPRRYTLSHSDETAELYLTIGPNFAYDKINSIRDEVFAEWVLVDRHYLCYVYVNVDGMSSNFEIAKKRNEIFRRELPLALKAIRYGDRLFFFAHATIDYSPIIVFLISVFPQLNKTEQWGTFSYYDHDNPSIQ